jgi:serine/threonine protein kinase
LTIDVRAQLQSALGAAYDIERELGGGGMSRVFLATDARLGRRVVVKVLSPDLSAGVSADRFEREIKLAARLQHPHIVPLLAAGDLDGLPFYTMPFIDGPFLRERLVAGARSHAESQSILRDVARALAYAHKQGIVHRDIKPENVLLAEGIAMVADGATLT